MHDDDLPNDSWSDWNSDWDDDDGPDFESEPEFGLSRELNEAERLIRIQQLREEIEKRGGSWESVADAGNLPPETEEALLNRVLFFETAPRTSYAKMLIEDGIELPPPDSLDGPLSMHAKLWEVIHGLAHRRVFLNCTDHLGDRELYSVLWFDALNHDTVDLSWDDGAGCHLDLLGDGSEEHMRLWLKYFADEDERHWWSETLQADAGDLPEHVDPPFNRDRILPKQEEY